MDWYLFNYSRCVLLLYFLTGAVLFIDQEKRKIHRHASSPLMMVIKLALAPLVLAWAGFQVLYAPVKFMWTHRTAGCVMGNRKPVYIPELSEVEKRMAGILAGLKDGDYVRVNDREREAADRYYKTHTIHFPLGNGRMATIFPPKPSSCSGATCHNAVENTRGANSLVRDDRIEEALCH